MKGLLPNPFHAYVYYTITSPFSLFIVDLESEWGHNVDNPIINVNKYLEAFIDCAMPFKYHII